LCAENQETKILLVEDSPDIVDAVDQILQLRWPDATLVSTALGRTGLELLAKEPPDIILLDLGLPDMDGFSILQEIRRLSDVPVVIVTVRADETALIRGLESGADDYITKPFSPSEFLARVKAALRRGTASEGSRDIPERPFRRGSLRVDFVSREISIGGRILRLSPSEYDLLREFAANERQVVSYNRLIQVGWGSEQSVNNQYVDVYVGRLKGTLEQDPGHPVKIQREDDLGYRLSVT
jgi:two-component system KDP operon response regulator KdpE